MNDSIRLAATAVLALPLLGCDDGPASNVSFTTASELWSFTQAAGAAGPITVAALGAPFGARAGTSSATVVDAMAGAFSEPWLNFAASDNPADSATRLVWLFDPASGFNADALCSASPPRPQPSAGQRMEIRLVYCQRDRVLAAVHGWMKRPAGAGDERFRALIRQMSRQALTGRG